MFNLQLANTYSPTKQYGVTTWYSSPKLDGVRCLYTSEQGLMSRSGKLKYVGLEHIESVCEAANIDGIIDGELYIPGESFDKVSGIVRDTKGYDVAQKQRVKFNVFASYDPQVLLSTEEMIEGVKNGLPSNQDAVIAVPYTLIENNPIAIQTQLQHIKESGLSDEGMMLRSPDWAYYLGRSNHLLKLKNFYKSEFTIIGFAKGTGKYSKSLGKLTVQGTVDNRQVKANVGTGFTDAERQETWDNQANYLGINCEVVYMGVTSTGSLRMPVFSNFSG
jgi:DNA ligase 1